MHSLKRSSSVLTYSRRLFLESHARRAFFHPLAGSLIFGSGHGSSDSVTFFQHRSSSSLRMKSRTHPFGSPYLRYLDEKKTRRAEQLLKRMEKKQSCAIILRKIPIHYGPEQILSHMNDSEALNLGVHPDIRYKRLDKVIGQRYAKMTFHSLKEAAFTIPQLMNLRVGVVAISIDVWVDVHAVTDAILQKALEKDKEGSIVDITTPLHSMPYKEQLVVKQKLVENATVTVTKGVIESAKRSLSGRLPAWMYELCNGKPEELEDSAIPCCRIEPIQPSPVLEGYRNTVNFSILADTEGKLCIGYRLGRTQDGSVSVADPAPCFPNTSKRALQIRDIMQDYLASNTDFTYYDHLNVTGFWRMLEVRNFTTGDAVVVLTVSREGVSQEKLNKFKSEFREFLENKSQELKQGSEPSPFRQTSFFLQYWERISNRISEDADLELVFGQGDAYEHICGRSFRVSPRAFFQINSAAATKLMSLVRQYFQVAQSKLGYRSRITLFDLCCGTGTYGILLSDLVRKVIGIEVVASAIVDARQNAELSHSKNCEFHAGKVESLLHNLMHNVPMSDKVVVVMNPPSSGVPKNALAVVRDHPRVSHVILVSCNPSTLANDVIVLCRRKPRSPNFKPIMCTPLDMFPHTEKVEMVMLLEREVSSLERTSWHNSRNFMEANE